MGDSPNCINHSNRPARWFCWACGNPLCEECVTLESGQYYCESCIEKDKIESAVLPSEDSSPRWPDIHYEANFIKRLLAFEIDFVILLLAGGLVSVLIRIIFQLGISESQKLFLSLFYGGLLVRDGIFAGGSPGKRIVELYVWNERKDRPVNLKDSILRNLFFPVFYFDLLTVPFSPDRQRAGDMLAGTVVYDKKSQIQEEKFIYRSAGLTSLLLLGLFVIFVSWFATEVRYRAPTLDFPEDRTQRVESVENALAGLGVEHHNLEVREEGPRLYISSEYPDADSYFKAREEIGALLNSYNYEIVAIDSPRMVLRGMDETYYGLEIEAKK